MTIVINCYRLVLHIFEMALRSSFYSLFDPFYGELFLLPFLPVILILNYFDTLTSQFIFHMLLIFSFFLVFFIIMFMFLNFFLTFIQFLFCIFCTVITINFIIYSWRILWFYISNSKLVLQISKFSEHSCETKFSCYAVLFSLPYFISYK